MWKRSVPPWLRLGLAMGLAVSLHVPVAVLLVWARPELQLGYPLVLLPLLLAGPLASRHFRGLQALGAAAAAGVLSSAVGVASLAIGSQLLDGYV